MASFTWTQQYEERVIRRVRVLMKNMPLWDSMEFRDMTEIELESIRHAGIYAVQYVDDNTASLMTHVQETTDVLTSLRYGILAENSVEFIRTGFVFDKSNQVVPRRLKEELQHALKKLNLNWFRFVNGAEVEDCHCLEMFELAVSLLHLDAEG